MALIRCQECRKQVSDQAFVCPHCGYPINGVPSSRLHDKSTDEILENLQKLESDYSRKCKELDVEKAYSELQSKYPEGIRQFESLCPKHGKDYIIQHERIIKECEQWCKELDRYDAWRLGQSEFSHQIVDASGMWDDELGLSLSWLKFNYYAPFCLFSNSRFGETVRLVYSNSRHLDYCYDAEATTPYEFELAHFYIDGYCNEDVKIYNSFTQELKNNSKSLSNLRDKGLLFKSSYFKILLQFVKNFGERICVLVDDSFAGHNAFVNKNLSHLTELLKDNNIYTFNLSDRLTIKNLGFEYAIIVDFDGEAKHSKRNCERIFELCDITKPFLVYFSIMREVPFEEIEEFMFNINLGNELPANFKEDYPKIAHYLYENDIKYFFHFTDRKNIASIREHGGLYSWKSCQNLGIEIANSGGDNDSRSLDVKYGLEDYVRLSFCSDHPMAWRLKHNGADLVLLRVKTDVAGFKDTLFSDLNATDNDHKHGGSLKDLKRIDISATQKPHQLNDSPLFKKHQAEVLVKSFIPIEYIENIDEF